MGKLIKNVKKAVGQKAGRVARALQAVVLRHVLGCLGGCLVDIPAPAGPTPPRRTMVTPVRRVVSAPAAVRPRPPVQVAPVAAQGAFPLPPASPARQEGVKTPKTTCKTPLVVQALFLVLSLLCLLVATTAVVAVVLASLGSASPSAAAYMPHLAAMYPNATVSHGFCVVPGFFLARPAPPCRHPLSLASGRGRQPALLPATAKNPSVHAKATFYPGAPLCAAAPVCLAAAAAEPQPQAAPCASCGPKGVSKSQVNIPLLAWRITVSLMPDFLVISVLVGAIAYATAPKTQDTPTVVSAQPWTGPTVGPTSRLRRMLGAVAALNPLGGTAFEYHAMLLAAEVAAGEKEEAVSSPSGNNSKKKGKGKLAAAREAGRSPQAKEGLIRTAWAASPAKSAPSGFKTFSLESQASLASSIAAQEMSPSAAAGAAKKMKRKEKKKRKLAAKQGPALGALDFQRTPPKSCSLPCSPASSPESNAGPAPSSSSGGAASAADLSEFSEGTIWDVLPLDE